MTIREKIRSELEQIRGASGDGLLRPEDVVEFAGDPATALHGEFTWDDTEAAKQFRLEQARRVIRVHVVTYEGVFEPIRAFVSLASDRRQPGGGYRRLEDVMSAADTRRQLLSQAHQEFLAWRRRYEHLRTLAPIFEAGERVFEERPEPGLVAAAQR